MKRQQPNQRQKANQRQKKQKQKIYWKDALRLTQQTETAEPTPHQRQQWTEASRQAEEDMEGAKRGDPEAVIWLPEEVARVIRRAEQESEDNPTPSPDRSQSWLSLTALLLGSVLLLLPSAISYFRAYRKIMAHTQ